MLRTDPASSLTAVPAALVLFAALSAPGVAALRRFAPEITPLERAAYGIPLGIVASSLGLLLLACRFGLTPGLIALWALACIALAVTLGFAGRGQRPSLGVAPRAHPANLRSFGLVWTTLVLGAFVIRWAVLWWGALTVDDSGLWAGFSNLWADWSQHLGDVSSFAYGDNFPPIHPRLWGHAFSYHYLTSVTVAAAVRLGLDPIVALPLHSFVLSVALLFGLYAFVHHFTENHIAASLAVGLFLLGGGWGWCLPLRSALSSPAELPALFAQPWDRAAQEAANFRWQNLYFSLIGPQRAYLYGLPLGMLTLRLLSGAVRDRAWRNFMVAGLVAGLLPLAHQGTLLSLALITPFLVLLFPGRRWVAFFGAWAALGLPQLVPMLHDGPGALSALRFHAGWIASPDPWGWFWLKNLGLFIPLALVGLLWRDALSAPARRFLLGLMPAFVIANLFLFQPWDWDNTKVLTYWFLAICILVAAVIVAAWNRWRAPIVRLALAAAVTSLVLSGLLLNLNQLLGRDRNVLLTREELDLARAVRERTPPRALFAAGLRHNHPITVLSGRRVIIGYTGWLWSQGMDYRQQERDLRAILAFSSEAPQLMAHYGVDYVVIGPEEREKLGADLAAYSARFPCVIRTATYCVFVVNRGQANPKIGIP